MVTNTNKEKHQQFGLKLLFIGIIIALVFTLWYISEKSDLQNKNSTDGQIISHQLQIPADDLRDLRDLHLKTAKDLMAYGYGSIALANNFSFLISNGEGGMEAQTNASDYWRDFDKINGVIDQDSATYNVYGNEVRIVFNAKIAEDQRRFLRIISFASSDQPNRTTLQPVLWQDVLLPADQSADSAPVAKGVLGKKITELVTADDLIMEGVLDNRIQKIDLGDKTGKTWTVYLFVPTAFIPDSNLQSLALKQLSQDLAELNAQMIVVTPNLPSTLQVWGLDYFGGTGFALLSDPMLKLADVFGFSDSSQMMTYAGLVIVDNEGQIRVVESTNKWSAQRISSVLTDMKDLLTPQLN